MTVSDTVAPGAAASGATSPFLSMRGISKQYGPTQANLGIDLAVHPGEVIGLVGGNGAGKSTLMKILCGVVSPTEGTITAGGSVVQGYDAVAAQEHGVRMVHQELSLCTNLTVAENFFIEAPGAARPYPGWRGAFRQRARAALDAVFPGHGLRVDMRVASLSIGERQMVEIARAVATPGVRLIILDEPTSSLNPERSRQLRAFVHSKASEGVAFIFISHKLSEIIDIATSVSVLRNGRLVWRGASSETSVGHLIGLMGGQDASEARTSTPATRGEAVIRLGGRWVGGPGRATPAAEITLECGQIVGLAGLEGSGQKEFLHAVFEGGPDVSRTGVASFVAGDRQKEGIFPLWPVLDNISIGRIARRRSFTSVSDRAEAKAASGPAAALRLDPGRLPSGITELSGGNQQKALVARALASDAPIILLDDPTRGVDIATKQDFYRLAAQIAEAGRTLLWYTTEDAELLAADRILVFAGGQIVADLTGEAVNEAAIVQASFSGLKEGGARGAPGATKGSQTEARLVSAAATVMPYVSLAIVLALMFNANPLTATAFGLELLLMPAVVLALVAVAQMFIVGGSEIDLGAGAFAGLVSVLSATLLVTQPGLGMLAIGAAVLAYASLGGLIQLRRIPAIVVTLGASFIWLGIGFSVQPTPGGSSPAWLSAAVNWSIPGVPTAIVLLAGIAAIAFSIDRTPLGVVLRGFGNNTSAMALSGWSPLRYALIRYFLAALFAASAGMMLTAINTASDINSGNSYTLLSVAAVVMGGCALLGGVISPLGVVVGAITLSLIGALLGMLNIASDLNAATQGILLLAILAFRNFANRRTEEA